MIWVTLIVILMGSALFKLGAYSVWKTILTFSILILLAIICLAVIGGLFMFFKNKVKRPLRLLDRN
jgi:hypothetical protein